MGTITVLILFFFASITRATVPLIEFISPSKESSPWKLILSNFSCESIPFDAIREIAIAKSRHEPSFGISAGAKFIIIFLGRIIP